MLPSSVLYLPRPQELHSIDFGFLANVPSRHGLHAALESAADAFEYRPLLQLLQAVAPDWS
jgi:hypothetical protein